MFFFFFFNDTATTEIYTLSLHDALPISDNGRWVAFASSAPDLVTNDTNNAQDVFVRDRKSTRLNSSHANISYAVFCLTNNKNKHCTSPQSKKTRTQTTQ